MSRSQTFVLGAAFAAVVALSACGGENPAGASGAVVLRGTVVGDATATASASSAHAAAGGARITVTVAEDSSLTTTVAGNGTFELSGLPEGDFTLVFSSNGVELGTITITGVEPGTEIKITVRVTSTTVILIEIENADGDDDDDEGEDDDDEDDDAERTCAISGGKVGQNINLEGNVADGTSASFDLRVNGNKVKTDDHLVAVTTSGSTKFVCNGKTSTGDCKASVKGGAKVHVKGTLTTCTLEDATVEANEVKVQK
jgi:hypothetical protein